MTNRRARPTSAARQAQIVNIALRDGLSGRQIQKRFGVNAGTFYRWRAEVVGRRRKVLARQRARNRATAATRAAAAKPRRSPKVTRDRVRHSIADHAPKVTPPRSGWMVPPNRDRAHYFRHWNALCGRYTIPLERRATVTLHDTPQREGGRYAVLPCSRCLPRSKARERHLRRDWKP